VWPHSCAAASPPGSTEMWLMHPPPRHGDICLANAPQFPYSGNQQPQGLKAARPEGGWNHPVISRNPFAIRGPPRLIICQRFVFWVCLASGAGHATIWIPSCRQRSFCELRGRKGRSAQSPSFTNKTAKAKLPTDRADQSGASSVKSRYGTSD
jgi:hypothetical protein